MRRMMMMVALQGPVLVLPTPTTTPTSPPSTPSSSSCSSTDSVDLESNAIPTPTSAVAATTTTTTSTTTTTTSTSSTSQGTGGIRATLQHWHDTLVHIKKGFQHQHSHAQGHQTDPNANASPLPLAIKTLLVLVSICIGVTLVIQVGANTRCGEVFGTEIRGSFVHFTIMALVTGLFQIHHFGVWFPLFYSSMRSSSFRWWHLMGGVLGAIFVTLSIVLVQQVGFALFFVASVAGQVATSLAFDTYGIMGYRKIPLRWMKVVGVVCTIIGCVLLQDYSSSGSPAKTVVLTVASCVVGGIPVLDAAVNNAYALLIRNPMAVAWISFVTGATCLGGVYFITLAWVPFQYHQDEQVWWQWSGGFLGAIFIISALYLPPVIGVATFFVTLVCGQLVFSHISDAYGIFGPVRDPSIASICGLIIALAGALLVSREHKQHQHHTHHHHHDHERTHTHGPEQHQHGDIGNVETQAQTIGLEVESEPKPPLQLQPHPSPSVQSSAGATGHVTRDTGAALALALVP